MNQQTEPPVAKVFGQDKTVAYILDSSTSTVWRLVKRGVIPPPIKINGLTRFDIAKTIEALRAAAETQGE